MTAREASLLLGKNEKYIYLLWKNDSSIFLKDSVAMKGSTLLITKQGYEYLIPLVKKEKDLAIINANSKVMSSVFTPRQDLHIINYNKVA